MEKQSIALFSSGNGSNAICIMDHFQHHPTIEVKLLVVNNKLAGVIKKTKNRIAQEIISNRDANNGSFLVDLMKRQEINYIVLAGYLRKIPPILIQHYPHHIINIHPALLPNYGGKGMYGMNVHKAIKENREKESGITIHVIDEEYDKGKIIAQHSTSILPSDSSKEIQQKVMQLEHRYFSEEVEKYIMGVNSVL